LKLIKLKNKYWERLLKIIWFKITIIWTRDVSSVLKDKLKKRIDDSTSSHEISTVSALELFPVRRYRIIIDRPFTWKLTRQKYEEKNISNRLRRRGIAFSELSSTPSSFCFNGTMEEKTEILISAQYIRVITYSISRSLSREKKVKCDVRRACGARQRRRRRRRHSFIVQPRAYIAVMLRSLNEKVIVFHSVLLQVLSSSSEVPS